MEESDFLELLRHRHMQFQPHINCSRSLGFVAACYQRGVPFIQIPTTLLSQVDSSVGGKTAVNHPLGKNMIGAFYQPDLVLIDTNSLITLPEREFAAGMPEVIKYGLIYDTELFDLPIFLLLYKNPF